MVGVRGFEPPALWSQTRCATKLRYTPLYMKRMGGFGPPTFWLYARRAASLRHILLFSLKLAGAEGLEPSARGFGDRCSTN